MMSCFEDTFQAVYDIFMVQLEMYVLVVGS